MSGTPQGAMQEYQIISALLGAERDFDYKGRVKPESPIEIKNFIGEVVFFEDLTKPYVTAQIGMLDDLGLISEVVELQGTETLKLIISGMEREVEKQEIEIELRVVSIVDQKKINDKTSIYVINCISKHAYADALIKLSRSYTGQLENIAENVVNDYLDVEVIRDPDYIAEGEASIQGRTKVITPYISPLETVEWLLERATTREGHPFFAWSSVWDQEKSGKDRIRFGSLETMLRKGKQKADKDLDFHFFRTAAGPSGENAKANKQLLYGIKLKNIENTLSMANQGTLGSRLATLDTYTSLKIDRQFDLQNYINTSAKSLNLRNAFENFYDPDDRIQIKKEEKRPSEFPARYRNMITSYGTYEWEFGYHDIDGRVDMLQKFSRTVTMSMLNKTNIDFTLSGYTFLNKEIKTGDLIKISIDSEFVEDEGASEWNDHSSGYFLITRLKHVFTDNKHHVQCTAVKLADLDDI